MAQPPPSSQPQLHLVARAYLIEKLARMTPTELSDATGIPRTHLSDVRSGARQVGYPMLERLAAGLGMTLGDMLHEMARVADRLELRGEENERARRGRADANERGGPQGLPRPRRR